MDKEKIQTINDLAEVYGGGVITSDRGQGSGGPGYISECELEEHGDTMISSVTIDEDKEAWDLAAFSARGHVLEKPSIVCVGEIRDDHQMIYSV